MLRSGANANADGFDDRGSSDAHATTPVFWCHAGACDLGGSRTAPGTCRMVADTPSHESVRCIPCRDRLTTCEASRVEAAHWPMAKRRNAPESPVMPDNSDHSASATVPDRSRPGALFHGDPCSYPASSVMRLPGLTTPRQPTKRRSGRTSAHRVSSQHGTTRIRRPPQQRVQIRFYPNPARLRATALVVG